MAVLNWGAVITNSLTLTFFWEPVVSFTSFCILDVVVLRVFVAAPFVPFDLATVPSFQEVLGLSYRTVKQPPEPKPRGPRSWSCLLLPEVLEDVRSQVLGVHVPVVDGVEVEGE